MKDRLRYFDAVVTPVALFGCGHRTVHQNGLHQLDVVCRKFLCAVVGPHLRTWIGHARGMIFLMIGMEGCNQSHWNMV